MKVGAGGTVIRRRRLEDSLPADFVTREAAARTEKQRLYAQVAEAWNAFEAEHGSFADEHSTL